jgi:hypothetical protein
MRKTDDALTSRNPRRSHLPRKGRFRVNSNTRNALSMKLHSGPVNRYRPRPTLFLATSIRSNVRLPHQQIESFFRRVSFLHTYELLMSAGMA